MATRSRARGLFAIACVLGPGMLAGCNAILGFDKFDEVQCTGACGDTGVPDVFLEGDADTGQGEADAPDDRDAGLSFETSTDAEIIPATRFWARWPMPTAETTGDASPYDDAGSDALYDPVTRLTWRRVSLAAMSYDDARKQCALGDGTWKVPTRIELATLIDAARDAGPAWNESFSEDAGSSLRMWTASPVATSTEYWIIDFATGAIVKGGAASRVRCVRLP